MNDIAIFWAAFCVLFILFELLSPGLFYFLSLAIGSGCAAITAYYQHNISLDFAILIITTLISFFLLKYWVKKSSKDTLHKTNSFALIGKQGKVTKTLSDKIKGWVSVEGEEWSAYSVDERQLNVGTFVEIIKISGSHLIVKKED